MAQEEIIFKLGVDTGDSVQDVNKVSDAIEEVGKDAKKSEGSFVNLRKELKTLTIQLQNLDPASKEFETVAKRAGQIKEQMRGVADAINDADPEKFGGKFQRTAEGIAGAFSAVTGAQALFGQQSEEIEKQMLKVQGAIALTQGISAMKELKNDATDLAMSIKGTVVNAFKSLTTAEMINATETGSLTLLQKGYAIAVGTSTGAMKAFRIALAATGIGLLIVGLGFLIEKMMSYMSSTDGATAAQDRFTASTKRFNNERDRMNKKLNDSIDFQINYAKAVGKSEKDVFEIEKQGFKKREAQRESDYYANLLRIETLKNKKKNALNAENMDLVKSINEEIANTRQKNNDLIDLKYQLQREETLATANFNKSQKEEQKKANEDALNKQKEANQKAKEQRNKNKEQLEKDEQDKLALKRKYEDLMAANITDTNVREQTELKLKHQRELEELAKQYGDKKLLKEDYDKTVKALEDNQKIEKDKLQKEQDERDKANEQAKIEKANLDAKSILEADLIRAEEDFALKQQKRIELENLDFAQQLQNKDLTNGEIEKITAQHEANLVAINKESKDRQIEIDNAIAEAKFNLANNIGGAIGAIGSLFEQGSKQAKAFALIQLGIDTATGFMSALRIAQQTAAGTGPAAAFTMPIFYAQQIASVIGAVSKAKSILGSGTSVQAPRMNTPMAQSSTPTKQGTQQTIQAQSTYKVVVVDSDITKMQDKTKKVQAISTI